MQGKGARGELRNFEGDVPPLPSKRLDMSNEARSVDITSLDNLDTFLNLSASYVLLYVHVAILIGGSNGGNSIVHGLVSYPDIRNAHLFNLISLKLALPLA